MGAKWTPGPWGVGNRFTMSGVYAANGDLVANTHGATRNYDVEALVEQQEANAHLIAAAPELYAACSSFDDMAMFTENADDEDVVVVTLGTVRKIRAALAKARGEA